MSTDRPPTSQPAVTHDVLHLVRSLRATTERLERAGVHRDVGQRRALRAVAQLCDEVTQRQQDVPEGAPLR